MTTKKTLYQIKRILELSQVHQKSTIDLLDSFNILLCKHVGNTTALYLSNNTILILTHNEHKKSKVWTIPWYQSVSTASLSQPPNLGTLEFGLVDMCLSNDSMWLGCITCQPIFYLVPIDRMIYEKRIEMLSLLNQRFGSQEFLSSVESKMKLKMTSFLDQKKISYSSSSIQRLQLGEGFGQPNCCKWWKSERAESMYCIVGSSEGNISFIHVDMMQEMCRFKFPGAILSIDIIHEINRKSKRNHLLVHTSTSKYYKLLIEIEDSSDPVLSFLQNQQPKCIDRFSMSCRLIPLSATSNEVGIGVFNEKKMIYSVHSNMTWALMGECSLPSNDSRKWIYFDSNILFSQDENTNEICLYSRPIRQLLPLTYQSNEILFLEQFYLANNTKEKIQWIFPDQKDPKGYYLISSIGVYHVFPKFNVYSLFDELCRHERSIEEAIAMGCALNTNMSQMFHMAAEGICEESVLSSRDWEWILELFHHSNATPSSIVSKLLEAGTTTTALIYSQEILQQVARHSSGFSQEERRKLSHLVLYSTQRFLSSQLNSNDKNNENPSLDGWTKLKIKTFLQRNQDYDVDHAFKFFLDHLYVEEAFIIAIEKNQIKEMLQMMTKRKISLNVESMNILKTNGFLDLLLLKEFHFLQRSLSFNDQIECILSCIHMIIHERDFILRHASELSLFHLNHLINLLYPIINEEIKENKTIFEVNRKDHNVVEKIPFEEIFELFLTILLHVNDSDINFEELLKKWKKKYRSWMLLLRCHDAKRWKEAALLYEMEEEWVHAIECRLKQEVCNQNTLIHLLTCFINQCQENKHVSVEKKASVLCRLIRQWTQQGYAKMELQEFFLKDVHFQILHPILFFLFLTSNTQDEMYQQIRQLDLFTGEFFIKLCQLELKINPTELEKKRMKMFQQVMQHIETNHLEEYNKTLTINPTYEKNFLIHSDPLETKGIVFTCGHVFPQRIFQQEILIEFERKIDASFPFMYRSKQILLQEYTNDKMHVGCPMCVYNEWTQDQMDMKPWDYEETMNQFITCSSSKS